MAKYCFITRDATHKERFTRFLALHPEVYAEFKRIAEDLLAHNVAHFSAKAIVCVMRYHALVDGRAEPECDNDYIGWMARKLASEDARFQDFFETRRMRNA